MDKEKAFNYWLVAPNSCRRSTAENVPRIVADLSHLTELSFIKHEEEGFEDWRLDKNLRACGDPRSEACGCPTSCPVVWLSCDAGTWRL